MKLFPLWIAIVLSWVALTRTDGFSPQKIEAPLHSEPDMPLKAEIAQILSQPFSYLRKGRQCFVFESLDGKFVLKFFNKTYFQLPWYSFFVREKEIAKRNRRKVFYEESYAIAFEEFGEEILYLHQGQGERLPFVSLVDRANREFRIDLTRVPFVLQKKGEPFYPTLEAIFQREGLQGLCREIDCFVEQVSLRISKQIADGDSDVEHNWGYVEGKIFHLDPGRLYFDPTLDTLQRQTHEWYAATHRLQKWLKAHHPEAAVYLSSKISQRKSG